MASVSIAGLLGVIKVPLALMPGSTTAFDRCLGLLSSHRCGVSISVRAFVPLLLKVLV